MYAREIDGIEHTFGVSGKLIMNALVMYEHQTRTLWCQFLGWGVDGLLKGVDLEFVPVTHTQWSLWKESHPDTLVLDKRGGYQRDIYLSYYYDSSAGAIGETVRDDRLSAVHQCVSGAETAGNESEDHGRGNPRHSATEEHIDSRDYQNDWPEPP